MKEFKDDNKKETLLKKLDSFVSFSIKENIYEFELEEKGTRIRFKRQMSESCHKEEKNVKKKVRIACEEVVSPLTGTFYRSSSSDTPAFVEVGNLIKEGQVLGLIEAMKLFNEIKSEVSGKVVEIPAEDGRGVKAGDVLMRIEKN